MRGVFVLVVYHTKKGFGLGNMCFFITCLKVDNEGLFLTRRSNLFHSFMVDGIKEFL